MTEGVIKTQGSRLYFGAITADIQKVACPTGITGLGGAGDQIDSTCLDSEEREYVRGMANPGAITVPINFIPRSEAHQALVTLKESGDTVSWMILFSDNSTPPVAVTNGHLVSVGPTSAEFLAYVADLNIDLSTNEIVRATLTLQRSGPVAWDFPIADLA